MPRDGDTPLARFARAVADGHAFSFGTPTLSDDGSLVTLPVLCRPVPPRRYVLAAEVQAGVSAVETGRLDRLRVRNDSAARTFLPPGTLFGGRETASRGTTVGCLLDPGSTSEVPVKCVHASQPVTPAATLVLAAFLAPAEIVQALLLQDQGLVWSLVSPLAAGSGGDLVQAMARHAAPSGAGRAPQAPDGPGAACGRVRLDAGGVMSVEVYGHPDSWRIADQDATVVDPPSGSAVRLPVDPTRAPAVAQEFLRQLARKPAGHLGTHGWATRDLAASCTVLDGDVIHFIAFGRPPAAREPAGPAVESASIAAPDSELAAPFHFDPSAPDGPASDDADVAVAQILESEAADAATSPAAVNAPRRRKVLTSGWDAATFEPLEFYTRKEFLGDRSAAIRFLVRRGLRQQGYLGPRPPLAHAADASLVDTSSPQTEIGRVPLLARIQELERIAGTDLYAGWLRERARLQIEQLSSSADEPVSTAARTALSRLPAEAAPEAPPEPIAPEPLETPEPETPAVAPPPAPPVDVRPLLRRAFAASAAGRYPEALGLFDEVLRAEPDNRTARLGRAVALRRSGKAQEALDALDEVLRSEPTNAAALLNRGRLLQERGDLRGALEAFDLLTGVAPNDWDVWMVRGDVLAKMGHLEDALASYGEALRRNPEDVDLQTRMRAVEAARASPPPKTAPRPALPAGIEEGQSYLMRERVREASYPTFRALAGQPMPSLLITSRSRTQALHEVGVGGVRIVGLSYALGEDLHNPTALAGLTRTIERFIEDNEGRGVILLDGLRELLSGNGFRDTMLFIEHVNEAIQQSHAIFLVSLPPASLPDKESALLERNLNVIE